MLREAADLPEAPLQQPLGFRVQVRLGFRVKALEEPSKPYVKVFAGVL